jgi:urease accessory protein
MLKQLSPTPLQRAKGRAHLGFVVKAGKTKLSDLHQSGSVKALLPRNHAARIDGVLVNTAGGVTGGDHLQYSAELSEGAELCLTTQTAERIYKASADTGRIETNFKLGAKAALDWLPQETILFEGSALARKITVEMDDTSSVLLLEPIVLGRKAMGETLKRCVLTDQWRVKRGGKLAYADALRITDPTRLNGAATLGTHRAFATLVYIAPDAEARRDYMRSLLNFDAVTAATSAWNGCLVTRFIAADAQPLRAALISTLTQFRAHPLPRVWHM